MINQHKNNNLIKIVPYFLSQKNKLFLFQSCKFANDSDKLATARLVMFKHFGIINSYTLEATYYAGVQRQANGYVRKRNIEPENQIKGQDLIELGSDFVQTLISIVNSKIMKRKFLVDTNIQYLYHLNSKNPPYKAKFTTAKPPLV